MANFESKFLKFRYRGNEGRSFVNLNDAIKLHYLKKTPCLMQDSEP